MRKFFFKVSDIRIKSEPLCMILPTEAESRYRFEISKTLFEKKKKSRKAILRTWLGQKSLHDSSSAAL